MPVEEPRAVAFGAQFDHGLVAGSATKRRRPQVEPTCGSAAASLGASMSAEPTTEEPMCESAGRVRQRLSTVPQSEPRD